MCKMVFLGSAWSKQTKRRTKMKDEEEIVNVSIEISFTSFISSNI